MDFNVDLFKKSFDFLPLGLRINNPGCIRYTSYNQWNGKKGSYRGFEKFDTFENGLRALTLLLMRYLYSYRLFDVHFMIERYAPYTDGNFPKIYAKRIIDSSGINYISEDIRLLKIELPMIIYQITCVENGSEYSSRSSDDDFQSYFMQKCVDFIDEFLNQCVYPIKGKVDQL